MIIFIANLLMSMPDKEFHSSVILNYFDFFSLKSEAFISVQNASMLCVSLVENPSNAFQYFVLTIFKTHSRTDARTSSRSISIMPPTTYTTWNGDVIKYFYGHGAYTWSETIDSLYPTELKYDKKVIRKSSGKHSPF